jgi:hypothetical protein
MHSILTNVRQHQEKKIHPQGLKETAASIKSEHEEYVIGRI